VKVRHEEGETEALKYVSGMTVIGVERCTEHHTIACVGLTKFDERGETKDGTRTVNASCVLETLRLIFRSVQQHMKPLT